MTNNIMCVFKDGLETLIHCGVGITQIFVSDSPKVRYKLTFDPKQETLAHYGVKGMKWGVWNDETKRRYQGSILKKVGELKISDVEKASVELGKAKLRGTLREGDWFYGTHPNYTEESTAESLIKILEKNGESTPSDAKERLQWKRDVREAADYLDALKKEEGFDALTDKSWGEDYIDKWNKEHYDLPEVTSYPASRSAFEFSKPSLISGEHTSQEDLSSVNSLKGAPGYTDNCALCSLSYSLRRNGYDVVAGTSLDGYTNAEMEKFWLGDRKHTYVMQDLMDDSEFVANARKYAEKSSAGELGEYIVSHYDDAILKAHPTGTGHGEVNGLYPDEFLGIGGGHSIAYEVSDGHVSYLDGQTGEPYKDSLEAFQHFKPELVSFMRTDDLTPDWTYLREIGAIKDRNSYYG